jgi:lysophospholipase L1-like esterase
LNKIRTGSKEFNVVERKPPVIVRPALGKFIASRSISLGCQTFENVYPLVIRGQLYLMLLRHVPLAGCTALFALSLMASALSAAEKFELCDGDRVVFLGNSFFERALDYGCLETALALRWPDRAITFRNLGWDGDTIYGHSRTAGRRRTVFGDPEEGFQRMIAHLDSLNPTVVFVAYGYNESFDGEAGIKRFANGWHRLVDAVRPSRTNRRIVVLSPTPMEEGFGASVQHVAAHNAMMRSYCKVLANSARKDGLLFVDLFGALKNCTVPYSENGIHPSGQGYVTIGKIIAEQLRLPALPVPRDSKYAEDVRLSIVKKNHLYFHRWRPRNDAFVYGERKDEQKVAQTEPEKIEPFVVEQERIIRELLGGVKKK